jgi:hypothetical protein
MALVLAMPAGGARQRQARLVEVARLAGAARDIDLAGPILVGARIVWARRELNGEVAVSAAANGRVSTLFRAAVPPLPPGIQDDAVYTAHVEQEIAALAASSGRIAFVRSARTVKDPRCRHTVPRCFLPLIVQPLFDELWAGGKKGPFRRVLGGRTKRVGSSCRRTKPTAIAVAGPAIVYSTSTETCEKDASLEHADIAWVRPGARTRIIATSRSPLGPVSAAGSFVAWGTNVRDEQFAQPRGPAAITVYNTRSHHIAYRVSASALRSTGTLAFDLQDDGTVAAVTEYPQSPCPLHVEWTPPATRRARVVRDGAAVLHIRVAKNRFVVGLARPGNCGVASQLALLDRNGRVQTVATAAPTALEPTFIDRYFDFDGRRVALARVKGSAPAPGSGARDYSTSIYLGAL